VSSVTIGEADARRQGYAAGYEAGAQSWRVEVEQRDADLLQARAALDATCAEIARLRAELTECRSEMAETGLEGRGA